MIHGIADDFITVDERAGRVFALNTFAVSVLDARTGTLMRSVSLGTTDSVPFSTGVVAVDARLGRVFVVTQPQNSIEQPIGPVRVAVLDAVSGAVLRVTRDARVGKDPRSVAVDGQTGRIFVLS